MVAGPVGAGKTSTLYNCLERINSPLRNIMTIEDPIEHRIPGVNQTQITPGEMGFSEGLRAMLVPQFPHLSMVAILPPFFTIDLAHHRAVCGHGSGGPGASGCRY